MGTYIADLGVVAVLIIGITAVMGVLVNSLGEKVFGGKHRNKYVHQNAKFQAGWKAVGGKRQ
ncbi:hypothetical protein [Neobacillus fumarioli]|uniref:hypothetical protein n=1 Tax=Neobacillus fumarioli TaxID=105229 RepID=UPI00082EEA8D|nr:hypothetical protein [Neobacillus fumarioli]